MKVFNFIISSFLIFFLFSSQAFSGEKGKDFEIEGFKIGMILSEKLDPSEISKGKNKNFYNQKYIKVIEFNKSDSSKFKTYDWIQFAFKKKDKKGKIIGIDGIKDYPDSIADCFAEKDKIVNNIKNSFKGISYTDDAGTKELQNKQGTSTTYWIFFKSRVTIYVSCYNYDSDKSSHIDALRIGVSNRYFDKYAFKK